MNDLIPLLSFNKNYNNTDILKILLVKNNEHKPPLLSLSIK